MSSEISSRISPKKVKIKISEKGQASFPVQIRYDSDKIAKGYAAGTATSNQQTVKVTGAKSDLKKIESVVADVDLQSGSKSTTSSNVLLRAISSSGKQLDVTISPETARVNIPIYLASSHKRVPIKVEARDSGISGKRYSFTTPTKYATITGTKDALKKIEQLVVPVSLVGVNADQDRTVSLISDRSGITSVSPQSVTVHIKVTNESSSSSSSSSASSGNNGSAENSSRAQNSVESPSPTKGSASKGSSVSSSSSPSSNNSSSDTGGS